MYKYFFNCLELLARPEYLALFISVIAISVNVYISRKNRKYALATEEYFKLQQITEDILSKLLIMEAQREKLMSWLQLSYQATQEENKIYIDINNTFDTSTFQNNIHNTASLIEIYFKDLGQDRNKCLDWISALMSQWYIKYIDKKSMSYWSRGRNKEI